MVVERRLPVKDDGVNAAAEPTRREESTSFIGDNLVVVGEVRIAEVFDGGELMCGCVCAQKKRILGSRTGLPGLFLGNSCRFFWRGKGPSPRFHVVPPTPRSTHDEVLPPPRGSRVH